MKEQPNQKSPMIINVVDQQMHDDILRLTQKLKGLQAEINAKTEALSYDNDESAISQKTHLSELSGEITKALAGINHLITMVLSEGISESAFLKMNGEDLDAFHAMVKNNLEKVEAMKQLF